jgi:hypothetical protein
MLNGCNKNHMPTKPGIFTVWSFTDQSLPIPGFSVGDYIPQVTLPDCLLVVEEKTFRNGIDSPLTAV